MSTIANLEEIKIGILKIEQKIDSIKDTPKNFEIKKKLKHKLGLLKDVVDEDLVREKGFYAKA